ncbi:hypothetical protein TCSYLVIO_005911, partial [Trypanosoma cruzi]
PRHVANDGVTTLPHQTNILMAGGVPSSAARRGSAAYKPPHGNAARPHFHPSTPLLSRTSPLDAQLPMEEDRSFCAFDVTTWPSRVWNEGASGVVFDLRCTYQCWQQDNEQVKLAFDNLVEWIGVLEGLQDPTDRFMNLGRSLLNTLRMQLTIASDPGIRLSKLRACLSTAVHQTKQARPLTKEEMNQVIRSRTDWKERVVFRLAWITASCWSEIAALTPKNFTMEADGTLILDWSVARKTARADPHRALRFVRIRGQDAFDIIKLCRTLQENEKLTNLTTAQVERALAPWNATAHSIKRGALRHAAQIVEAYNLDPHVISQLAQHVDPFDLPQNTVRYLGRYTTLLTQLPSLVAFM